jgi:hypothetical protein
MMNRSTLVTNPLTVKLGSMEAEFTCKILSIKYFFHP